MTVPAPASDAQRFLADLDSLVTVESPTGDVDACTSALRTLAGLIARDTGRTPETVSSGGRPHLWLPAAGRCRVLLLGHIDTVWPVGTLARWPLAVDGDVVTGPGTFDMKAGLVMALHALAALGGPDEVAVLVTTDEETGSATSQGIIERAGRDADAVLVLEPSGPGGAVKVGRKGVGLFDAHLRGRAAHAGLEPENGVNATVALAALVPLVAATADPAVGTTVTPTTAVSGVTRNTVPAAATLAIDVRAATELELNRVRTELTALGPEVGGADLRIEELGWRPPLEPRMSAGLWDDYIAVCAELGVPHPDPVTVGGGSDGNFTAAVGTPTLDGLGAVGEGAHAEGEQILLQPTLMATAILTGLMNRLLHGDQAGRRS